MEQLVWVFFLLGLGNGAFAYWDMTAWSSQLESMLETVQRIRLPRLPDTPRPKQRSAASQKQSREDATGNRWRQ